MTSWSDYVLSLHCSLLGYNLNRLWSEITFCCWSSLCVSCLSYSLKVNLATSIEDGGSIVEKLTGENHYAWKFQMKMALIGKDVWEIVTGEEVLNEDASQADRRKLQRRSNMALATIWLSVAVNIQIYVRSAVNAKEAWRI